MCVGADVAAVMQGHRNDLCTKLQMRIVPYMVPIHYMVHRLNLACKIVHDHEEVVRVDELNHELYAYFCCSPKCFLEFQKSAKGITDGNKLLKDVETRWISIRGLAKQVFS